jgi:hypothetical protein
MDLRVEFDGNEPPPWPAVDAAFQARGWAVTMRMIDNELSFPDETPPDSWRELRVGADGAMVTIRRSANGVALVAWGNADATQRRLWHRLAWAFATAGAGRVVTESGTMTPEEFMHASGNEVV